MSFQRKKSKRVSQVKFNRSEIYEEESQHNLSCRLASTVSDIVIHSKFHRQHEKRKDPTSNFFKRMKSVALISSSRQISGISEKCLNGSAQDINKKEQQIQDVMKNHETYVRIKTIHNSGQEIPRNHCSDSRKLSALFTDKIPLQELNPSNHQENEVTKRDLKYLPMHDVLNYQGQVTSNPKLIERRLLHKVKKAFMGK